MIQTVYQWPPLESDPNIFKKYFDDIGLPKLLQFEELICLDYQEIQCFDDPVIGVICAVRRLKPMFFDDKDYLNWNDLPFFMRQTADLDMACGLIAGLHCVGNQELVMKMMEQSILKEFYEKSKDLDDLERAKLLQQMNDFKIKHIIHSQEGQSYMPSGKDDDPEEVKQENKPSRNKVYYHYIAFINHNNNLLELDGLRKGPIIIKKDTTAESILDDTVEELKKRLTEGYISEDMSIMVMTGF